MTPTFLPEGSRVLGSSNHSTLHHTRAAAQDAPDRTSLEAQPELDWKESWFKGFSHWHFCPNCWMYRCSRCSHLHSESDARRPWSIPSWPVPIGLLHYLHRSGCRGWGVEMIFHKFSCWVMSVSPPFLSQSIAKWYNMNCALGHSFAFDQVTKFDSPRLFWRFLKQMAPLMRAKTVELALSWTPFQGRSFAPWALHGRVP